MYGFPVMGACQHKAVHRAVLTQPPRFHRAKVAPTKVRKFERPRAIATAHLQVSASASYVNYPLSFAIRNIGVRRPKGVRPRGPAGSPWRGPAQGGQLLPRARFSGARSQTTHQR